MTKKRFAGFGERRTRDEYGSPKYPKGVAKIRSGSTIAAAFTLFAGAAALVGLPTLGASAQEASTHLTLDAPPGTPSEVPSDFQLRVKPHGDLRLPRLRVGAETLAASAQGATLPLWSSRVTVAASLGGRTDSFTMVGANPTIPGSSHTTTVPTIIIPVIFSFEPQNIVFDPTTKDACEPNSALALTELSPIFKNFTLAVGGTNVGTGELAGLFQRANFYRFTKPGGLNPNFGFALTPSNVVVLKITANNFPNSVGAPCDRIGLIEINSWDSFVQKSLFPLLKSLGVGPTTLPLFLFYNVVLYDTTPSNCCILGYHNAFLNPSFGNTFQTYSIADFDTTRAFRGVSDISIMSHEIDEWQDDPAGNNPTPAWGHVGQVSGCQTNLEVGDPLSGTSATIPLNGFSYHTQDLTFFSWFYRGSATMAGIGSPNTIANFGVNGWYSLLGTFRSDAGPLCH